MPGPGLVCPGNLGWWRAPGSMWPGWPGSPCSTRTAIRSAGFVTRWSRPVARGRPPQVVGLVAELPGAGEHLPPDRAGDVPSTPDAIMLSTGTLNLRRFEKRPTELLVLGRAAGPPGHDRRDRPRPRRWSTSRWSRPALGDWGLTRLAVREQRRSPDRPARPASTNSTGPRCPACSGPDAGQGTESFLAVLEKMRPADLAHVLQDLPDPRRNEVAALWTTSAWPMCSPSCLSHDQVEILASLDLERAADVLEKWIRTTPPTFWPNCPSGAGERCWTLMEPEESSSVRRPAALRRRHGGRADDLGADHLDARTRRWPRRWPAFASRRSPPAVAAAVFVARAPMATPSGRFLGMVHFQKLLREPPAALLGGVVDNDIEPLRPDTALAEITRKMARYNLVSIPAVDAPMTDWLARSPSMTCSTICCRADWRDRYHFAHAGGWPWLTRAATGSTSPGSAPPGSRCRATTRTRSASGPKAIARFMGTARFLVLHDGHRDRLGCLEHRDAELVGSSTRTRSSS